MNKSSRRLSFDIDSARDHLDKMVREANRLEATENRLDKSDHAINAAMTGWHLHEWIWAEVKDAERSDLPISSDLDADEREQLRLQHQARKRQLAQLRVKISKELGVSSASVGKTEFGMYMARRHPSIEMCRIIATGSKHLSVDESGVEVETFVSSAASEPPTEKNETSKAAVDLVYRGTPKIRFGGLVCGSSDVIREAEQVWTEFIYKNKIDK